MVTISSIASKLLPNVTGLGVASWASMVKLISRNNTVTVIFLCINFSKNIRVFLIV
jgi:hypothetical protein